MSNQNVFPTTELREKTGLFANTEKIVLFLLFVCFLDYKGQGCYFALFAGAFFLLISGGNVTLSKGLIPPIFLAGTLAVSWEAVTDYRYNLFMVICMPVCFFIGYGFIDMDFLGDEMLENAEKRVKGIIAVITAGFFVHFLMNMLLNIGSTSSGRDTVDIWTRQSRAATGQVALVCLAIGLIMALLFSRSSKLVKTICAVCLALIVIYNFTLSTRTIFLMIFIIGSVAAVNLFKNSEDAEGKLKIVIAIIAVVFVLWALVAVNAFGIRDIFEDSNFYKRFFGYRSTDLDHDNRWRYKKEFVEMMPKYLWGGGNMKKIAGNYAHDILLDTYDEVGIVGLIAVFILLVCAIAKFVRVIRHPLVSFGTKQFIICIFLAFALEFSIEPILQGAPLLLIAFCMVYGMLSALLEQAEGKLE